VTVVPQTGDVAQGSTTDNPRRWDKLLALVLANVVLLAAGAGLFLLIRSHNHTRDLRQARVDAIVAARQLIINLDGVSAATADRDFERINDTTTGEFKKQFVTIEATLKSLLESRKTISNALIVSAAVVSGTTTRASVLVAEDRTVSDNTTTTPAVRAQRWSVSLVKQNDVWLVSGLASVV
jgi:Mce-associated membrane protein